MKQIEISNEANDRPSQAAAVSDDAADSTSPRRTWEEFQPALAAAFQTHQAGNLPAAEEDYRRILAAAPDHPEARHLLGVLCYQTQRNQEAVQELQRAIELDGSIAVYRNHLGAALLAAGQSEAAEHAFREALRLNPNDAQSHYNLAVVIAERGQNNEAEREYREAIRLDPRCAEAFFNLGNLLRDQKRNEEAIELYRHALEINPRYVKAGLALGALLFVEDRLEESANAYRNVTIAHPQHAEAHFRLACVLQALKKLNEASQCFAAAVQANPEHVEAKYGRALNLLVQGDFARGWPEYEWRLQCKQYVPRQFLQPRWDGSALGGRTLLVYTEQGFGDTFHFIRYIRLLVDRGNRVLLEVPKSMFPLLMQSGFGNLVPQGEPLPDFDLQIPLLSLPLALGTTLQTIPWSGPYITPNAALVNTWRERLRSLPGYRIGINWQGNPEYKLDRHRSFPLAELEPVANVPNVRLISLQKLHGLEQLASLKRKFEVIDLGEQLDGQDAAFMDTAAVMKNLDLIITSDSAVAHLAGAMGVPVWLATSYVMEWRWLDQREDSPWYPTMRLFRQPKLSDWRSVFERMAKELKIVQGSREAVWQDSWQDDFLIMD